ncbi:MAG: glycosyltransferase family 4 protein [Patescibacteria group bacterium]|nr:glycosyltransferase family 4 protein [Patescibacteria group bacterium]
MKVLIPVLHYYPVIGGLETWTQNIAERLSDKADIFIVTGKVKDKPNKENLREVDISRTSLYSLRDLSYSSPLYILTALPFIFLKSLFLIKKEKINICHCQGFLSSFLGYLLFNLTKTPYVVTVQRLEKNSFLRKLVYRNAKTCIAASSAIKDYFIEIGSKDIVVIPNGIDLRRFSNLDRKENRAKLGLDNKFTIMTIARLEKVKGIRYLIQSLPLLDINYQLLIVGDGSERESLENMVKKLGLDNKVEFLGQIQNEKIPDYLIVADCSILPSLKEGFGIVILEAIASKVPVVATRVGGILDIIEDEKTGLLVESKNPDQIAKAIYRIYSQPELARDLVANASLNLVKYDWQNITGEVHKIYKRLIL